jgi:hypothetical protein
MNQQKTVVAMAKEIQMTQHTPGPCKCRLYINPLGGPGVEYCAMHAAAPEMLDAIKHALTTLNNMTTEQFRGGADRQLRQYLNALLAKIEGKE